MPYVQRDATGAIVGQFVNLQPGLAEEWLESGAAELQPAPADTATSLCLQVDTAADTARVRVAGDPLRAVEYDRARIEAEKFAAADYQGDVPPMVGAWVLSGRTPQESADGILREAAVYTAALVGLRTVRLWAKEQIRIECRAGRLAQASAIAEEAVEAIQNIVIEIGNNVDFN